MKGKKLFEAKEKSDMFMRQVPSFHVLIKWGPKRLRAQVGLNGSKLDQNTL